MNILLTNDDGYDSVGIKTLKKALSKYGTVIVVAPDSPRSANSAALTLGAPIKLVKVSDDIYKCSGTPVDCVSIGLCQFNIDFDIVVSGCNNGYNISYDTMYSGTVGAALEALVFHKPAIAVSTYYGSSFEEVTEHFDKVWEYIFKNNLLSDKYLLNVNFPLGEVKGISLANLYYRNDQNYFIQEKDGYYAYRHMQEDFSDDKNSDCYLYKHNIISVVPLSRTYFSSDLVKKI